MKPYQHGDVVVIDVPMLANSHIQAGKRPWVVVQKQCRQSVFFHQHCRSPDH